jgi:ADP-ribose pyrophosphatase YjhB (NUDIX family)/predicted transcriptional regulator
MQITHYIQLQILKQLLFKPLSTFTELNVTGVSTDHFNFHLKQLIKLGIVEKKDDYYKLTTKGMELAGRIDPTSGLELKQPKVGVAVCLMRELTGNYEFLLGERLRDQSIGRVGFYTSKVRFGESLFETVIRCVKEETGLTVEKDDINFAGTVHVTRHKKEVPFVDVVLTVFKITKFSGNLLPETNETKNYWVNYKDIPNLKNAFDGLMDEVDCCLKDEKYFIERRIEES